MKTLNFLIALSVMIMVSCAPAEYENPVSDTGVKKVSADISTGSDGLTAEQRNVKSRIEEDNKIGAIKHLYVISAFSGQVIIYSTVDGKVTSGGKRLTPKTVASYNHQIVGHEHRVYLGNTSYYTNEVLGDDGTYGSSSEYLYWWDVKGVYHQHFVSGGQIVHISEEAMPVSEVIINLSSE